MQLVLCAAFYAEGEKISIRSVNYLPKLSFSGKNLTSSIDYPLEMGHTFSVRV